MKPHLNRSTTAHTMVNVLQRNSVSKVQTTQWRRRHLMVAVGRPPRPRPHPCWPRHSRTHPSDASPPPFPPCPGLGGHFHRCSMERRTAPQVIDVDADALKPRLVKPWAPQHRRRPFAPRGGLRRAQGSVPSLDINAPMRTRRTPQNDEEEDDAPQASPSSILRLKLRRVAADLGE